MSEVTDVHCPPRFNLPRIPEVLQKEPNAIKLDLRNGFWHVYLHSQARRWFGVKCNNRVFQWKVLPMGWAWAPYFMQILTKHIVLTLCDMLPVSPSTYLDDLFIQESDADLCTVLNRFSRADTEGCLAINWSKSIVKPSSCIEYLGLNLDLASSTVSLPPRKMVTWKRCCQLCPSKLSLHALRRFRGFFVFLAQALRWPLGLLRFIPSTGFWSIAITLPTSVSWDDALLALRAPTRTHMFVDATPWSVAVVSLDRVLHCQFSTRFPIYVTELLAVLIALQWIAKEHIYDCLIFTDNQAVLFNVSHTLLFRSRPLFPHVLVWIPSVIDRF